MCSEKDAGAEVFDEFDGFWGSCFPQSGACGVGDGVSSSSCRCLCKDLRVWRYECNKLINLSLYVLSIVLWYYTHLSTICVNLWFWHTYEMHSVFLRKNGHYVKTSNRSCNICNRPLMPITSTHICNGCCLAPVTYKHARTTPWLASTTPVTNVDFW
jgi:hypothetical protein